MKKYCKENSLGMKTEWLRNEKKMIVECREKTHGFKREREKNGQGMKREYLKNEKRMPNKLKKDEKELLK